MTTQTTYSLGSSVVLSVPTAITGLLPYWTLSDSRQIFKTRSSAAKTLLWLRKQKGLKIIRQKEIIVDADSAFERENESRIRQAIY